MQKLLVKNIIFDKTKIIKILNNIFDKKVYRFTYLGICKLNKMPEYNFWVYEFNVMLEDYSNYTVYIRKFSNIKFEENLFCYWQFCEENYNLHCNFYLNKANLQNEFSKSKKDYIQKYSLQLLSKNNIIWKASDINIVDLNKLKYKRDNIDSKRMIKVSNSKEYLFIGII